MHFPCSKIILSIQKIKVNQIVFFFKSTLLNTVTGKELKVNYNDIKLPNKSMIYRGKQVAITIKGDAGTPPHIVQTSATNE